MRLAVCHPEEAARERIASRLRGATVELCADLSQLRTREKGDAVMLAGVAEWSAVEGLLTAGAHVLLVANPCPPSSVIDTLFASAQKIWVQLIVVNPERYLPSRQLIRQQLLSGPLGEAGLLRVHRWEPPAPNIAPTATGLPDALLRDLDVVLWLTALEPDRVFAVEHKSDATGRYIQVHLGFPHGGMALVDYTNQLPAGDGYQSLSVIAASGAAYADDHQNTQLLYRGVHPHGIRTEETAAALAAIAQEFVDALRDMRELSTSMVNAWREVFVVAEAVQKSLASGRVVEWR